MAAITGLASCSSLKLAVSSSLDGTVRVWDNTNKLLRCVRCHQYKAFNQSVKAVTFIQGVTYWVTTCLENLENLEMSGNLEHVREMSGMLLTVREMSGKKSCHGKVSQNCSLLDEY